MVWLVLSRTSAPFYQARVRDLSRHRQASFAALMFPAFFVLHQGLIQGPRVMPLIDSVDPRMR
jgi:hypothetical protein